MRIISGFIRTVAGAWLDHALERMAAPYGVTAIHDFERSEGFRFSARISLDGDADVTVTGQLEFRADGVVVKSIHADRAWITKLANAIPALKQVLPLSASQVNRLRKLWP